MTSSESPLRLVPGTWYAWQMYPGYSVVPYASPILINSVTPLKSGRKELDIAFYNAFYAEGVRDFSARLRGLAHHPQYLMAAIVEKTGDGYDGPRSCVITDMTPHWLELLVPNLYRRWRQDPPSDVNSELSNFLIND